jgi:hypothetical protein
MENGGNMAAENGEKLTENVVPLPVYPPQIPHRLAKNLTRSFAVKSQRLTFLAMAFS